MSCDPEKFPPIPATAPPVGIETLVAPNPPAIALAMHERMQPIAEEIEDILLAHFVPKKAAGSVTPADTSICNVLTARGTLLLREPQDVVALPQQYVAQAALFMHQVVFSAPAAGADIFKDYRPIKTEGRWSDYFTEGVTDKWEGYVLTLLRMEDEGLPRPASYHEVAYMACAYGLYRY